jgi:hypothetical protein
MNAKVTILFSHWKMTFLIKCSSLKVGGLSRIFLDEMFLSWQVKSFGRLPVGMLMVGWCSVG